MAKISGRGVTPLLLNNPTEKVELVEHFSETKLVSFDYTGAFDVSEVLGNVMKGKSGDAVTNMTITIKSDASTFFLNLFTLGFANAKKFQVEGDLVRTSKGASSLLDGGTVLGYATALDGLRASLADFAGAPESSPMVVRTDSGFVLVQSSR